MESQLLCGKLQNCKVVELVLSSVASTLYHCPPLALITASILLGIDDTKLEITCGMQCHMSLICC